MRALAATYGRALTTLFFAAALGWALVLIALPQAAMLERALTVPPRALDSTVVASLLRDARTCAGALEGQRDRASGPEPESSAPAANGGLAVPSFSGPAASSGGLAVPSLTGPTGPDAGTGGRFILQCERATTLRALPRPAGEEARLAVLHDLPDVAVDAGDPVETRIADAELVAAIAADLLPRLRAAEEAAPSLTAANFAALVQSSAIPLSEAAREAARRDPGKRLLTLLGLRWEEDGTVRERLGLVVLVRTLAYAAAATALALLVCYPVAYKLALATPPERAVWLLLGLVVPYAVVELVRIYAWTAIISNNGVLNAALMGLGLADSPVAFARSPLTVFAVVVYVYVLFMVFPMLTVMSTLERAQVEAARDLGASTWRVHRRIVIPHARPGIAVGCIATFMLAAGAFSVPRIVSSGLQAEWFAQTIYNRFFEAGNANAGAAYSLAFTAICFALIAVFMRLTGTRLADFARAR